MRLKPAPATGNVRFGAPLLIAPMAEDAPQFSLTRSEQDAFAMRRKAAAAVRTEFRAIMPAGRAGARISVARDGRGNSVVRGAAQDLEKRRQGEEETAPPSRISESPSLRVSPSRAFDYDAEAERLREEEAHAAPLLPE